MPHSAAQSGSHMRAFCLCLFFLGQSFGHAQDFKKVTCRFLALDSNTPPPPLLNIGDKGSEVACTVYTNTLSPPTVCFGKENVLSFISTGDRKPAALATVPAGVSAAIMIFVAAPKDPKTPNALPWRVFVIDDTVKNFPDGGAFVANFHNQDIRFIIGESKVMLHPAGFHGFPMPKERNNFNMAPVLFEFLQKDQWRTASESMLRFLPGIRYLIFAYVDPASDRPRIATFQDFGNPKPSAPPKSTPGKPVVPK